MLLKKVVDHLKTREFISVATCDFEGRPNAAPKFLLKHDAQHIYLIDYTIGRTWANLKNNPRASISFMDADSLTGYQINGTVETLDQGVAYEKIMKEYQDKEITLSAQRIIEGLARGKKHEAFEAGLSEKVVVLKVTINEIVELTYRGELRREQVC